MNDDDNADLSAADAAREYASDIGSALLSDLSEKQRAGAVTDAAKILTDLSQIKKSNVETYATMMIVCESIFKGFHDYMRDHKPAKH